MSSEAEAPAQGRPAGGARTEGKNPDVLRKLGRYDIEKKLGAGGMGAVYLARDTKLRRQVALKVLPQDKASNPVLVRRFEAEAQAAAQLRHDNIVAVYDSGKAEGFLYIAMEYVDGIDLHELVARRGTIPVKRSIEIIKQAASALQHAADHKIVHRDIKPSNLLIRRDGAVKITDLGLARSVDDTIETGITRAGTTVGTVDYMAPEQARSSKAADIRSDIYSLGCTWYHMLAGTPPYPEGSLTNKLQAHAAKPLPDPRSVNNQVTDALVAVLHRMMAKRPEDRYQTPGDLLKDLESSTLTHAAFSQEIFHAIEEEEAESARAKTDETSEGDGRASVVVQSEGKPAKRHTPATLPPPTRRKPVSTEDEQQSQATADKLKVLAAIAGAIVVVCGLGWLVSSVGGVFDSPSSLAVTPTVAPDAEGDVGATGPAAVSGGVAPGTELVNTAPTVAPVYGGPSPQTGPLTVGSAASVATSLNPTLSTGTSPNGVYSSTGQSTTGPPAIKLPDDPVKRPDDIDQPIDTAKLPIWTVGLGNPSATHFASLNEALSRAVDQAVVIKLLGRGPFLLTNAAPLRVRELHLVNDGQTSPLIVLSTSADGSPGRLHLSGNLTLDGVHVVIDRQASTVDEPLAMLIVENGDLVLRASSLTALQTGKTPLAAVSIRATLRPPRVLLSQTAIRGEFNVGLDLLAPSVEVVLDESLLAVGNGSAIRLRGEGTDQARAEPIRLIRSFSSTMACRGSLFDVSPDEALDAAPETHVVLVDTVCSTGEGSGSKIMLNADGWLQSRLRESFHWTNSNSALLGFQTLIDLGASSSFKANDAEGWRSFWRKSVEPHEFASIEWPTGVAHLSTANPSNFGRDQLPPAIRTAGARGVMPGVPVEKLSVPESVYPERMAALAKRTAFAAIPWAVGSPMKFDLRKNDLGVFLSKGDFPDRAVIEAIGYGVCTMQPAVLNGRQVKIVFRQAEGGPLRLLAKEPARTAAGLFQVKDGVLELEGLRWQLLDVKPSSPKWLVSAVDSQVILRDCDLAGPDAAHTPFEGLIRFETTAVADRAHRPQLGIFDSYLHAPGTLLRIEASDGGVFINNSVLAARGVAMDVRPRAVGDRLPLTMDLTHCTVSAQNTAIRVAEASSLSQAAKLPVRWFVDNCAFVPPIELRAGDASTPTLLTYIGAVLERSEFEWWGRSNGVAKEIRYWLRPEGSLPDADQSDESAWLKTWGDAHELHALTGEGGVILRNPLPTRRDQIQADDFLLRSSSKAMTWAEGRPIGAILGESHPVGPKAAPKDSPATNKTPAKKSPGKAKPAKGPAF